MIIEKLERAQWLLDHESTEEEVMIDAEDREYIMTESLEGEMEEGVMTEFSGRKIYLP